MSQTGILLEVGTNELEIVEFFIEEQDGYRGYYGINVSKVVEIIRPQAVTSMPQMQHSSILGAFSHRGGNVMPLIDLCAYLNKGPTTTLDAKVIITEFNTVRNAFLVSGVTRIHRINWSQVEPPNSLMLEMSNNSITGVVRLENRVVFLLDMEAIVGTLHPQLSVHLDIDETTPPPEKTYRLLHIEDSASIRRLVRNKLMSEGRFELTQANDGLEAWNLLQEVRSWAVEDGRKVTDYFQAVITDIEMPNMDGLTLCRRIKEDHVLCALPVIMFSSLISPAMKHKCETVGADAQFAKPDLKAISDYVYEFLSSNNRLQDTP